jgi:DNA polymerase
MLWLDFETRSRCDLISRGGYNYAKDISTSVLCLSYAFNDEDVQTWLPHQPFPQKIVEFIVSGGQIRAHNAAFERLIFWYVLCPDYNVPEPKLEQFYCTATQARANCAPGSLEDVGRFSGASMRKDHRGSQLIRLLSIPKSDGTFNDDPTLMAEMVAYCEQDVRAMRAISKAMRQLSDEELADYHVNERINDRGVLVDTELCTAAIGYASVELEEIQKIVSEVTNGEITSVRSTKMREWVLARVGNEAKKLMETYKDDVKKYSIDKSVRANLLVLAQENPDQVPPNVADVIQCATDLWASSVAKFKRLKELADVEDQRVRGAFVFAGGSATGRASSYGVQFQNMPRKIAENPTTVRQAMVRGHAIVPTFGRKVTDILKSMLRPALIPAKGNVFVCYDWNAIEARVNPWLSNHASAREVLDVFKLNKEIYVREAASIFHCDEKDVTPQQRSIGKVAILACSFGGGVGAFEAMGRIYGVHLPESDAKRTVNAWRRSNPWAVQAWGKLESAYTRAMRNKNHEFTADKITYLFDGQHLWYALPSGRVLCYPFANLDENGITYAKAAWKPAATDKEWPRARLWHGIAIENCVQATANDLLRHACRVLDQEGFATVATIHDEIIVECKEAESDKVCKRIKEIMLTPPKWCQDLPLAVAGGVVQHYE